MTWIVLAFGAFVSVMGMLGVLRPTTLVRLVVRVWSQPWGPSLAVGARAVLGVALLLAAPHALHPTALRVLGAIALVAAAVVPVLGRERLDRFVAWWAGRPIAFVRAWGAVALAFGSFLIFEVA